MGGLSHVGTDVQQKHRETWRYDPGRDQWEERAAFPAGISGWAADLYAGHWILAVGGVMGVEDHPLPDEGEHDALAEQALWNDLAFAYDTQEDRWLRLDGALPPGGAFNDPGVCIVGDTIYVAGAEGPRGTHYNHFLAGRILPSMDGK